MIHSRKSIRVVSVVKKRRGRPFLRWIDYVDQTAFRDTFVDFAAKPGCLKVFSKAGLGTPIVIL